MTDQAVLDLAPLLGTTDACVAAGRPRATHYRRHRASPAPPVRARIAHVDRVQPAALLAGERAEIVQVLHSERFCDAAPAQVWATLLDEGIYLGSQSTFYRLLRTVHGDVRERRSQATHPAKVKPELVAHGPNQVWSWDITKLHGPAKWSYFYLYVILDVYSRKTVGWMLATRESEAGVAMMRVVGVEELAAERPGVLKGGELAGEARAVLQGLELRFAVGVVVTDPGAAVGLGDSQVGQEQRDRFGGHAAAPVGVQGELPGRDVLGPDGGRDQLLGQARVADSRVASIQPTVLRL